MNIHRINHARKDIPLSNKLPNHPSPNASPQRTIQRRVPGREAPLTIAVVGRPFLQRTRLKGQTLAHQFSDCFDFKRGDFASLREFRRARYEQIQDPINPPYPKRIASGQTT